MRSGLVEELAAGGHDMYESRKVSMNVAAGLR